jgi:Family of unknown function (DUF6082)
MTIAIISILISSIALVAVAVSLLLQARQLRASQIQTSRAAQVELIKLAFDNRELVSEIYGNKSEDYFKGAYINWLVKYLELSYSMKVISEDSARLQITRLFTADYPYEWWARVRDVYDVEATTKSERRFLAITDEAFRLATQQRQSNPAEAQLSMSSQVFACRR